MDTVAEVDGPVIAAPPDVMQTEIAAGLALLDLSLIHIHHLHIYFDTLRVKSQLHILCQLY